MEAARDLVGVVVELPARVEVRQDDLERLALVDRVRARPGCRARCPRRSRCRRRGRSTRHVVAVARLRLVDRVVDELRDHVVEARDVVGVPDVHPGPLAHGLEPLQELDRLGAVARSRAVACRRRSGAGSSTLSSLPRPRRGDRGLAPARAEDPLAREAPGASSGRGSRPGAAARATASGRAEVRKTWPSSGSASANAARTAGSHSESKSSKARAGAVPPASAARSASSASVQARTRVRFSPDDARVASGRPAARRTTSSRWGPTRQRPARRSSAPARACRARRAAAKLSAVPSAGRSLTSSRVRSLERCSEACGVRGESRERGRRGPPPRHGDRRAGVGHRLS